MIKGVIFDADGTLLDSMGFWDDVVNHMLISMGVTPDDNLTEILTPMSMSEGAEYIKDRYGIDVSVGEIIEAENRIVDDFYNSKVTLKKGMSELLDFLRDNKVHITCASATDKVLIEGAFNHLKILDYFEKVLSCSDVGEGKTSPKVYLAACEEMNIVPTETLVVEDSLLGLQTAKASGFKTLAVYDKSHNKLWERIKAVADYYIDDYFEINYVKCILNEGK